MPLRAVALLLTLLALAACRRGTADGPPVVVAADDGGVFVGDEQCATCHADLYAAYHRTGMGRSVSVFDPATAPERFGPDGRSPTVCHEASGYCFEAFVRGDTLFQRETHPDEPGWERVYAASHVVGSGNATRSYLMTAGSDAPASGYVTEMPLTWYVERALWDLSPGYTRSNARFERPIALECLTCHNANPGHAPGTQNFYTEVPLGISCERCHGSGAAHVEAHLEGEYEGGPEGDPTIVNPARLPADGQLAVCQQCHLTGITVFQPGEDATTYRPGQPLAAHRTVFAAAKSDDAEAFGIASHAERMMKSACFEQTQGLAGAMTCTTCHDPHRPTAEMDADHFNAACRSCHGGNAPGGAAHEAVCSRPATAAAPTAAMTGDCVSCHLRVGGTSDIPHVTFTDHWIRRTLPPARRAGTGTPEPESATPYRLVDVTLRESRLAHGSQRRAAAETDLEAGIAYFVLYETEHRLPAYLPLVAARIRRGLAGGADRPDARLALGRALLGMDSLAAAETALAHAAADAPSDALAAYWLGVARLRQANAAGAVAALTDAVRLQPRLTEARLKLGEALAAAARPTEAVAAYEEALRRDPIRHAAGWNDLGFLHARQNRPADARRAYARALALDPRLAPARVNLGALDLAEGKLSTAQRHFEAALRADPAYAPALGNLGLVYARQGRRADARRLFERLLALNPGDARAAAYLADLE